MLDFKVWYHTQSEKAKTALKLMGIIVSIGVVVVVVKALVD